MKRKDTKKYEELVDKYCEDRMSYECNKETAQEYKEKLEQEKNAFDNLQHKNNEHVKKWFESYSNVTKASISMLNNLAQMAKERMEIPENILQKEYEENLNELYTQWKNKWGIK